jgi:hypothetical protein
MFRGRVRSGLGRPQRRQERLRSPRALRGRASLRSSRRSLRSLVAVLTSAGHRAERSPFESARTWPVAARGVPALPRVARVRPQGAHHARPGRRAVARSAGSGIRKRASATPAEPARQRRAEPLPALVRGGLGPLAPQWNHHARTLGGTAASWRTPEGRGRSLAPRRRKHHSAGPEWRSGERSSPAAHRNRRFRGRRPQGAATRPEREERSEPRGHERPRASVASPAASHTPKLQHNARYLGQNTQTNTEVNT